MRPAAILESALYVDDLDAAEAFYGDLLGLERIAKDEGRHVFFRCGSGVVLLFYARATEVPRAPGAGLPVPPHGAHGPGVYTADWAERPDGSGRDFLMAMQKVETLLQDRGATTPDRRTGRFVAVLCLAWPDGHAEYFRGEVEGTLVWPPRGDKGFGYDPVFKPDGYDQTFGEMTAGEKHAWEPGRGDLGLSHRARAFARFATAMLETA